MNIEILQAEIERPEDVPDNPLYWFWRAECVVFHYGNGPKVYVNFHRYRVIKRTPAGVWVRPCYDWRPGQNAKPDRLKHGDKLVFPNARRAHAYATRREALNSLVVRTKWRVVHTRNAYERALAAQATLKEHFA